MDSNPNSPVLIQHSSPPHSLSPHGRLQNSLSSFEPLADTTTTSPPPQITLSEEPVSAASMEEAEHPSEPRVVAHERTESINSSAIDTLQSPDVQSASVEPGSPPPAEATSTTLQMGNEGPVSPEETSEQHSDAPNTENGISNTETSLNAPNTAPDPPPPPPPASEEPKVDIAVPEWVLYEEDTSEISEEELKSLQCSDADISALDVLHHEKKIYTDFDDPEQRPVRKLRLSWTIKGVRGTKERPNYARVMNSPAACIDGYYWYIKFFPRGNNSSQLSTYITCSPTPPPPDSIVPENVFKVFEGPPEADLGKIEPVVDLLIPATPSKKDEVTPPKSSDKTTNSEKPEALELAEETSASADNSEKTQHKTISNAEIDWRISAQIGTVIYNPAEPRCKHYKSSEHQFNKHSEDWGWTNFGVKWNDIHTRHPFERKPLLQSDTLTIDAYIQIHEDPTQALWWHQSSDSEMQWDSKSLTGYYAFGTPSLYHSPGVAGLSALLLLKPFREILESIDSGRWRRDSQAKPRPLISQLQIILFLMRAMKKQELYVNVNPVLETLDSFCESFSTVPQFWEVLRRSIELELEDIDDGAEPLAKLAEIFDVGAVSNGIPITLASPLKISVEDVEDVQTGIQKSLASGTGRQSFPKFLPIALDRQKFDVLTRQWKLLHNRVKLNEELNLSEFSIDEVSSYTLYGFAVHVGERNSGKSYSVLRPSGPGTKWLAFEDDDGNKIFSYTKKRIQDFEGLEGDALSSLRSTRQTAYVVMYIRTDCLNQFLPGALEPYDEHNVDWVKLHLSRSGVAFNGEVKPKRPDVDKEERKEISIEIFDAEKVRGRKGLLDMYNLRDRSQPFQRFVLPAKTTFKEVRRMLAESMWIDNVESIRFWQMQYGLLGEYMTATMHRPKLEYAIVGWKYKDFKPLCLWFDILRTDEDIQQFGIPDPPDRVKPKIDQLGLFDDSVDSSSDNCADSNNALNLLFSENQVELSSGSDAPAGTVSTPTSGATDDQIVPATREEVLQSVEAAVSATITAMHNLTAMPTSDNNRAPNITEDFDFDSFLNLPISSDEVGLAGDATPRATPVEHGHLVDAVTAERTEQSLHQGSSVPELDEESAAVIAALIAADVEAADSVVVEQVATENIVPSLPHETQPESSVETAVVTSEPQSDATISTVPETATSLPSEENKPQELISRPAVHVYGFIQLFDIDQQEFVIHSTFFASWTADVKETVRKALGYEAGRAINVWQRERSCNTAAINNGLTFREIHFKDGVDLVVGDPISDKKKADLIAEGKFVTPDSLSRYHWMRYRHHPVEAFTGTKILDTFGQNYYSGPFLNGRFHGNNGKLINSTGHTYIGPFESGIRQGAEGTMTYQNGDVYTGSFLNNERHGQGTFIQKRTGNKYVGSYVNDKRWGKGVMYYEVGDEEGDMCQICYGEEMDALFYDCGHICACVECARQVEICPICRKPVKEVVKVYRA